MRRWNWGMLAALAFCLAVWGGVALIVWAGSR